jgi:hypothetical protein
MPTQSYQPPGSVSGSVSITGPLPAGTNVIGVTGVAQGSTTAGESGPLVQGAVVSGNSAFTAGTTNPLTMTAVGGLKTALYSSTGTAAAFASSGAIMTGGVYSTTPAVVGNAALAGAQIDPRANAYVNTEARIPTYSAAASIVLAASATDVFTIYGSASTSVRIRRIEISGVATAAGGMQVSLVKRSAVNTSGTSSAVTAVPHDAADAAATATCLAYTANPTSGTTVGTIRTFNLPMPAIAAAVNPIVETFGGDRADKSLVLTGVAQGLAINFNGGTVPTGGTVLISVEWTEY